MAAAPGKDEGGLADAPATDIGPALWTAFTTYCKNAPGAGRRLVLHHHDGQPKMSQAQFITLCQDIGAAEPQGPIKTYMLQTIFASYKPLGGSTLTYTHFLKAMEAASAQCQTNLLPRVAELALRQAQGQQQQQQPGARKAQRPSSVPAGTVATPSRGLPRLDGGGHAQGAAQGTQSPSQEAAVAASGQGRPVSAWARVDPPPQAAAAGVGAAAAAYPQAPFVPVYRNWMPSSGELLAGPEGQGHHHHHHAEGSPSGLPLKPPSRRKSRTTSPSQFRGPSDAAAAAARSSHPDFYVTQQDLMALAVRLAVLEERTPGQVHLLSPPPISGRGTAGGTQGSSPGAGTGAGVSAPDTRVPEAGGAPDRYPHLTVSMIERLAALEAQAAESASRLAALERAPPQTQSEGNGEVADVAAALVQLQARLAGQEQATAAAQAATDKQAEELQELRQRLAAAEAVAAKAAPAAGAWNTGVAPALAQAELAELESRLAVRLTEAEVRVQLLEERERGSAAMALGTTGPGTKQMRFAILDLEDNVKALQMAVERLQREAIEVMGKAEHAERVVRRIAQAQRVSYNGPLGPQSPNASLSMAAAVGSMGPFFPPPRAGGAASRGGPRDQSEPIMQALEAASNQLAELSRRLGQVEKEVAVVPPILKGQRADLMAALGDAEARITVLEEQSAAAGGASAAASLSAEELVALRTRADEALNVASEASYAASSAKVVADEAMSRASAAERGISGLDARIAVAEAASAAAALKATAAPKPAASAVSSSSLDEVMESIQSLDSRVAGLEDGAALAEAAEAATATLSDRLTQVDERLAEVGRHADQQAALAQRLAEDVAQLQAQVAQQQEQSAQAAAAVAAAPATNGPDAKALMAHGAKLAALEQSLATLESSLGSKIQEATETHATRIQELQAAVAEAKSGAAAAAEAAKAVAAGSRRASVTSGSAILPGSALSEEDNNRIVQLEVSMASAKKQLAALKAEADEAAEAAQARAEEAAARPSMHRQVSASGEWVLGNLDQLADALASMTQNVAGMQADINALKAAREQGQVATAAAAGSGGAAAKGPGSAKGTPGKGSTPASKAAGAVAESEASAPKLAELSTSVAALQKSVAALQKAAADKGDGAGAEVAAEVKDLAAQLDVVQKAQGKALADLESKLTAAEQARVSDLEEKIGTVVNKIAESDWAHDYSALEARLDELAAKLADVESRMSDSSGSTAAEAVAADLGSKAGAGDQAAHGEHALDLESRVAALEAAAAAGTAAAVVSAAAAAAEDAPAGAAVASQVQALQGAQQQVQSGLAAVEESLEALKSAQQQLQQQVQQQAAAAEQVQGSQGQGADSTKALGEQLAALELAQQKAQSGSEASGAKIRELDVAQQKAQASLQALEAAHQQAAQQAQAALEALQAALGSKLDAVEGALSTKLQTLEAKMEAQGSSIALRVKLLEAAAGGNESGARALAPAAAGASLAELEAKLSAQEMNFASRLSGVDAKALGADQAVKALQAAVEDLRTVQSKQAAEMEGRVAQLEAKTPAAGGAGGRVAQLEAKAPAAGGAGDAAAAVAAGAEVAQVAVALEQLKGQQAKLAGVEAAVAEARRVQEQQGRDIQDLRSKVAIAAGSGPGSGQDLSEGLVSTQIQRIQAEVKSLTSQQAGFEQKMQAALLAQSGAMDTRLSQLEAARASEPSPLAAVDAKMAEFRTAFGSRIMALEAKFVSYEQAYEQDIKQVRTLLDVEASKSMKALAALSLEVQSGLSKAEARIDTLESSAASTPALQSSGPRASSAAGGSAGAEERSQVLSSDVVAKVTAVQIQVAELEAKVERWQAAAGGSPSPSAPPAPAAGAAATAATAELSDLRSRLAALEAAAQPGRALTTQASITGGDVVPKVAELQLRLQAVETRLDSQPAQQASPATPQQLAALRQLEAMSSVRSRFSVSGVEGEASGDSPAGTESRSTVRDIRNALVMVTKELSGRIQVLEAAMKTVASAPPSVYGSMIQPGGAPAGAVAATAAGQGAMLDMARTVADLQSKVLRLESVNQASRMVSRSNTLDRSSTVQRAVSSLGTPPSPPPVTATSLRRRDGSSGSGPGSALGDEASRGDLVGSGSLASAPGLPEGFSLNLQILKEGSPGEAATAGDLSRVAVLLKKEVDAAEGRLSKRMDAGDKVFIKLAQQMDMLNHKVSTIALKVGEEPL